MKAGAIVESVQPGTAGQQAGIAPGDVILRIGGKPVLDILDYMYLTSSPSFRIDLMRDGHELTARVRREDEGQPLGIVLADELGDGIRHCRAHCDFCFLDQMPRGYRPTLYIKDDDYRLSFLHGNFVTLTNLDEDDWRKIKRMHLSPMHISVHATNPVVRRAILKNPQSERILEDMRRLASWDITMHTQVVVQPGLNDGDELERTIREIAAFHPHVESLAIVPVGLTKWRDRCTPIEPVTPDMARRTIRSVKKWQRRFEKELGYPFAWLSDEYYLLAGVPLPGHAHYGEYPQLENGVGLCRLFLTEFNRRKRHLPGRIAAPRRVLVATGYSAGQVLPEMIAHLNRIENLEVELVVVRNEFLGPSVTVAGLLGGRDILEALRARGPADVALIPAVSLREGDGVFLDDFRLDAMQAALPYPVLPCDASGADFIQAVLGRPTRSRRLAVA